MANLASRMGRPKKEHPQKVLKVSCTDEEFQLIIGAIPDTRERATILLVKAKRTTVQNKEVRST